MLIQVVSMSKKECPSCEAPDGNNCVVCCSHINTKLHTSSSGPKGRYLTELIECQDCGYEEVVNEIDYYTEFPAL